MWKYLVYIPQVAHRPLLIADWFVLPIFVYIRLELIMWDVIYIRFDYFGACQMRNIPLQKEGGQVFLCEWSAWNGLPAPVTPRFRFDNVDYYFYLPPPNVEYWEPW